MVNETWTTATMPVQHPPEPIFSDYVEMISLVVMFVVGAPLNLAAYTQLAERPLSTRLELLKRSLNYSDLLVLFVYVPSRACWLLTYDWRGGDFLCKIVKMLHTFAFQSSSNVIVCIALDRLMSVLSSSHHSPAKAQRRTKAMLLIAWAIALIISLPQLYVWQSYLALPDFNWSQCLQIWEIARLQNVSIGPETFDAESWYSILHICCVFWIPAMIVLISYVVVLSWVWMNSRPSISNSMSAHTFSIHTGCETVDTVLTRASEWNPLKNFSRSLQVKDEKKMQNPRIVVSDESSAPLTQRPSISPSEASAVMRTGVHNSASYNASVTRSRALRVSFLLVAAYIVCWLPYNLLSLIHLLDSGLFNANLKKFYFLHEFIIFNSVVNPYLYGLFAKNDKARFPRVK
ncbi:unnamed protein product [Caenorhabditis auriculariae]|uniref:G-protein coupled receptors family 1 profile domain-containing protein n=1 Tax=Caenorhabditis auriculariae TaxID=2777116 RepID=A0A8S1HF58_9PELO|nr:unnamed protein product [Caenorhabditis auriculariae]